MNKMRLLIDIPDGYALDDIDSIIRNLFEREEIPILKLEVEL